MAVQDARKRILWQLGVSGSPGAHFVFVIEVKATTYAHD